MAQKLPTPEQIAETMRALRKREDQILEMYAGMDTPTLLKQIGTFMLCGDVGIPTTADDATPQLEPVVNVLIERTPPRPFTGEVATQTALRWSMAFKELARRISEATSDDSSFRVSVNDLRLHQLGDEETQEAFRSQVRVLLSQEPIVE